FQSRISFHADSLFPGVWIVHSAPANVRVLFPGVDGAGAGKIPARNDLAAVDTAPDFSGLGEHSRIFHHWHRPYWTLFGVRLVQLQRGQRGSDSMDTQAETAIGVRAAAVHRGLADYAIRNEAGGVSVRHGLFAAGERGQRD